MTGPTSSAQRTSAATQTTWRRAGSAGSPSTPSRSPASPGVGSRAELVGELAPAAAGGGERLGPAPAALQRTHELEPERFAQRMLGDERGELAEHLLVAAQGEVGLDARAETGERSSSRRATSPTAKDS